MFGTLASAALYSANATSGRIDCGGLKHRRHRRDRHRLDKASIPGYSYGRRACACHGMMQRIARPPARGRNDGNIGK